MESPKTYDYDIIIAGGGASGLAAASAIGLTSKCKVAILEKKEVVGKKLTATGNGRCNLSNSACENLDEVQAFFRELGIVTRTDDSGRMYPYSEEAVQVTQLLRDSALDFNTEIFTNCQVLWAKADETAKSCGGGGFIVGVKQGSSERIFSCRRLLLAMGGKSYSVFGTTGDGYGIAKSFGHTVTRLAPSLVPVIVCEDISACSGVRTKGRVSLMRNGCVVFREEGEIQFNKDTLSGICVMNLSKHLILDGSKPLAEGFADYSIEIDLVPEMCEEELAKLLAKMAQGDGSCEEWLRTLVKSKLAGYLALLCDESNGDASNSDDLGGFDVPDGDSTPNRDKVGRLVVLLKHLTFNVKGTKGWNEAQVTRGGVSLDEIDSESMESRLVPGLYFAGEITDFDGLAAALI